MPDRNCRGRPWLHGKFKGCGYRLTMGREAILGVLSKHAGHLSAEDIYMKVHPGHPNVGLTTIYRTLDVLSNLGLVYKLDFGEGRARYELAQGPKGAHHHHHLVCTGCNKIIDYTDFIDEEVELLKETERGLSRKYDFNITNHIIQFYGLCEKCKGKK
ncbi:MAG: Fur family transcriptional regulator [Candidatus Omnitrophica bacterium]|nr:Fur family transcriptional regulator [Candidatus Omnitrophota bacterium]MDD5552581.1 Fur family transcriptional regulator [Candidatus Omnitrophota bacterium]